MRIYLRSHVSWRFSTLPGENQIISILVECWRSLSAYCLMSKNCYFMCFAWFFSCLRQKYKNLVPVTQFWLKAEIANPSVSNFNYFLFLEYLILLQIFLFCIQLQVVLLYFEIYSTDFFFLHLIISVSEIFKNLMFLCVCWLSLKVVCFFVRFINFFFIVSWFFFQNLIENKDKFFQMESGLASARLLWKLPESLKLNPKLRFL